MPRYTYRCNGCDEVFDVFHAIAATPSGCAHCESTDLDKLVSKPSIITKSDNADENKKVGSVVESSIEEFRDDLKQQRKDLSERTKHV